MRDLGRGTRKLPKIKIGTKMPRLIHGHESKRSKLGTALRKAS